MFTDSLKAQHRELISTLEELRELIGTTVQGNLDASNRLRKQLVKLSALVTLHLATEDKFLYPNMMKHKNPSVAETARQFSIEMGGIASAFKLFILHWPNGATISENAGQFAAEFDATARTLSSRIVAEERVLYPLLDRVGP